MVNIIFEHTIQSFLTYVFWVSVLEATPNHIPLPFPKGKPLGSQLVGLKYHVHFDTLTMTRWIRGGL